MRAYRAVWWAVSSAVAAPATAISYLAWTPTGVAILAAFAAMYISWFAVLVSVFNGEPVTLVDCARTSAQVAFGVVAAVSLLDVFGTGALALLALAAGTSPILMRSMLCRFQRARARRRDRSVRLALDVVAQERAWDELLAELVAQMSDVDLCWAWRTSYRTLVERPDPAWRTQVARARHAYLLELERRHPRQLEDWLATSPRPASGPERFLRSGNDGDGPRA
jgi:hypothetical protein